MRAKRMTLATTTAAAGPRGGISGTGQARGRRGEVAGMPEAVCDSSNAGPQGDPQEPPPPLAPPGARSFSAYSGRMSRPLRIAFISRRNSLRSVLAQACLGHLAAAKFTASSAGQPGLVAPHFHPAALGALRSAGIEAPAGPPRGWDSMLRPGAPAMDFLITLDEALAREAPRWPGQPELATWPFPDIAAGEDGEAMAVAAIRMLYSLRRRLELLASLPLAGADRSAVRADVRDLAHWP